LAVTMWPTSAILPNDDSKNSRHASSSGKRSLNWSISIIPPLFYFGGNITIADCQIRTNISLFFDHRTEKFDRAAVLTDKTWLKTVSELEGVFFPGLEIKAFDRDQKAEAWLSS